MAQNEQPPRVRIAPSPTGDPHVGTAYIALFNYVFARKHGGSFVLRIEDTDQARSTEGSEAAIFEALEWLGLNWDEGPDKGGDYGPYRQSERLELYRSEVDRLLESGEAYRCFCSRERLDGLRKQQMAEKRSILGYDRHCRSLSAEESSKRAKAGEAFTVRMKIPDGEATTFVDGLRGEVRFDNAQLDDQVILKSDGFPTYHLANVVDDHHMKISHVIRGEEWINSTPKHIILYRILGWEPPKFYHLGLLRNPDGSKLSKRKNPVSVFHYRDIGYMPETVVNFLGTMGFSISGDRERFTLEEMIEHFDWSRVSTGGPVFAQPKLQAFSGDDIRALDSDELYRRVVEQVLSEGRIKALLEQAQPRIDRLDDFIPYVSCFFGDELDFTPMQQKLRVKKRSRKEVVGILKTFLEEIEKDPGARSFQKEGLESFSRSFLERHEWKGRELFSLLRIAATGRSAAPPLFDTLVLCGKDRFRSRLRTLIAFIQAGEDW